LDTKYHFTFQHFIYITLQAFSACIELSLAFLMAMLSPRASLVLSKCHFYSGEGGDWITRMGSFGREKCHGIGVVKDMMWPLSTAYYLVL
jgi:hypothetical protein